MKQVDAQQESYITARSAMKQGDAVPHAQQESYTAPRSAMKQGDAMHLTYSFYIIVAWDRCPYPSVPYLILGLPLAN